MSDPAIEAVLRAVQLTRERRGETFHVEGAEIYELLCDVAEDAAREVLKPIRELHRELTDELTPPYDEVMTALDVKYVLDKLAPLIYSTEELGR